MFRTIVLVSLLIGISFAQSGCTAMRENSRRMVDVFKPSDYADWTNDVSDPWVQEAGAQARGNRPRESLGEPDWFHNMLTSEKARDIERNTGFDAH
jgi:hypothetical protein